MNKKDSILPIPIEKTRGHQLFQKFATRFSKIYSTELNPFYHLGDMAILFFMIACISGIYVFIFYNIDPRHAWDSVEAISGNFFNAAMRSIHRYSSDLLVVFILMHLIHTLISGKFKRLVSWISGIISFFIVILIGVTGYILVWDQKAKLTGYLTAKFFSGIPIFDPSIAGAFLLNDLSVVGGFFKVALFGHIVFSLLTIIIIWIHVMWISKPKIISPKKLIIYTSLALIIISVIFPVKSDPPAQLSNLPLSTTFDWFYYFGYYLMKLFSVSQNWAIMIGSGLLLCILPYVFKRKNRPPVKIDLEKCDACNLCSYDCPYEAIDMLLLNDQKKAILSADKCVGCGICIGSCREHAIFHPDYPILNLQQNNMTDMTVFSCSYFPKTEFPEELKIVNYDVPCLGSILAKDVQKILNNNSKSVAFLGCEDCYYRHGKTWAVKRFFRKRAPAFSKKQDVSKVQLFTLTKYSKKKLVEFFRTVTETENRENKLLVNDHHKTSSILSVLILTAFFSLMVPLSSTVVRFFNPAEKVLIVNFKYVSSPTEFVKSSASGIHMQTLNPIVKKRSSVLLRIFSSKNKALIYEKEYLPRGLKQDIAMFIYTQLVITEDEVDVELVETAFPEKQFRLNNIQLKKGDGTFVVFKENKLMIPE